MAKNPSYALDRANALAMLAQTHLAAGGFETAVPLAAEAATSIRHLLDEGREDSRDHLPAPLSILALHALGDGRLEEARALMDEAVETQRAALPTSHSAIALAGLLHRRNHVLVEDGELEAALADIDEAADLVMAVRMPSLPIEIATQMEVEMLAALADTAAKAGDSTRALAAIDAVLERAEQLPRSGEMLVGVDVVFQNACTACNTIADHADAIPDHAVRAVGRMLRLLAHWSHTGPLDMVGEALSGLVSDIDEDPELAEQLPTELAWAIAALAVVERRRGDASARMAALSRARTVLAALDPTPEAEAIERSLLIPAQNEIGA